jgi:hypothetical protein
MGNTTLANTKLRNGFNDKKFTVVCMQRPLRKPRNRMHIVVAGIDNQWSADLMDTIKFSKYNDVFTYVLVVIDVSPNIYGYES